MNGKKEKAIRRLVRNQKLRFNRALIDELYELRFLQRVMIGVCLIFRHRIKA